MTIGDLAAQFRKVLMEHEHGALGGIDLAEALAQAAVAALTTPQEGDAHDAIACVLADHTITTALDGGAECECGEWSGPWSANAPEKHQADRLLAAFPVLYESTSLEGDAHARVAQVVTDALDAELPEEQRTGEPTVMDENVATALMAAFPVLGRDIEGEIEALNAEILRLQKRNSDMSWALYPDRMGQ